MHNQIDKIQLDSDGAVMQLVRAYTELRLFNKDVLEKVKQQQEYKNQFVITVKDKITELEKQLNVNRCENEMLRTENHQLRITTEQNKMDNEYAAK